MDAQPILDGGILAAVLTLVLLTCAAADDRSPTTRPAYCAGNWYPGDASALAREVDDLLGKATPPKLAGKPVGVIAPHAGYRYSAPVAATAYRCLQGHTYSRVFVVAFSHSAAGAYKGVDVPSDLGAYDTPLGPVPIDRTVCDALLKQRPFASHPGMGDGEHSLELQLPFLQRVLKDFRLVPLLVGQLSEEECTAAAKALGPWLDGDTLIVASSDFTHFGRPYGYEPFKDDVPTKLKKLAEDAAAPLLRCDYDGFVKHLADTDDTICGRGPIRLLLRSLSMQGGAEGVLAASDTSGRMTGDWSASVTYQSIVFTRLAGTLDSAQRTELLRLARETVAAHLNRREPTRVDADKLPAPLRADGACFVTLQNHGELRGCIGNMTADGPLHEAVIRNAISACEDPRFVTHPVTAKELDELHIEISYLTPMKRVANPDSIVVGRHGLLIAMERQRGVLLPQVAYERGWTRDEFLAQTCRKAGLPPDAWKRPEAEIYSFEAEVFGEPEQKP